MHVYIQSLPMPHRIQVKANTLRLTFEQFLGTEFLIGLDLAGLGRLTKGGLFR